MMIHLYHTTHQSYYRRKERDSETAHSYYRYGEYFRCAHFSTCRSRGIMSLRESWYKQYTFSKHLF